MNAFNAAQSVSKNQHFTSCILAFITFVTVGTAAINFRSAQVYIDRNLIRHCILDYSSHGKINKKYLKLNKIEQI